MRKIFLTLMIASLAGVMCSCEEDDKLVTNADAVTVSAGSVDSLTTPNTARVKVWYKKENYSQIQTAGILFGTVKDLDFLVTYGEDINIKFDRRDTCVFDLTELDPNTEYYYVGYAKLASGASSYSGIRFLKTLKDDISVTPGLVTFNPVSLEDASATTLTSSVVVKTLYADWTPSVDNETYPWIKSVKRLDDTTMQVTVDVIKEKEAALAGRSGQVRIMATTNENATKSRSVLINQLAAATTLTNPAEDYVYAVRAQANPVNNVATSNVGFDVESCEAPEWITGIKVGVSGGISFECQANTGVDYREGTVKIVTAMTGEENYIKVKQDPAMLMAADTVYIDYAEGSTGTVGCMSFEKTEQSLSGTLKTIKENASPELNAAFNITAPRGGGLTFKALADNRCLEDQIYPLTVYYKGGDQTYTSEIYVYHYATTFEIDQNSFEFPKSMATYTVTASKEGATIDCDADWIEATVSGTTVSIKTTSEASSERTAIVNVVWGEHVCPVTVKQLTVNDGVAQDATVNEKITVPYTETVPVAVDFNDVLDKFGLTATAMDAYYIASTASGKGKFKEDTKSVIWRALLADGTPYTSEMGANLYTGEGYGSWFDAEGNACTSATGVIALNFDEATNNINVVTTEAAEVGKTYSGQLQIAYSQPAEGKLNTYTIKVTVTISTALLKEVVFTGTTGSESYNNRTIDSLMAYAFSVEEDMIAGMIQNGEIEMVGLNADGTEVAQKTYGTTGFIFSADGNVGTYPNPVYIEYKNSRIYISVVDGMAATVPSGTYAVKFKYNGIELPVYFK
ncbi:MAG: hypothetical protein E7071_06300 [Bacteroidales bacterium]|nr:hypothetical protein [Bacteroidales bacterium]